MLLKEIDFTAFEAVKKKVFTFANDGNTVIQPYRTLYSFTEISHDSAHKHIFVEVVTDEYNWKMYYIYEDIGLCCYRMQVLHNVDMLTVERLIESVNSYEWGLDGFFKRLKQAEGNNQHISILEIKVCEEVGEIALARHYMEYRKNRLEALDAQRAKEWSEREAAEKAEEEKYIAETVAEAENTLKSHKPLDNKDFNNTTLILYLFKKYEINIPLKTQGWINQALATIQFKVDGTCAYSYLRSSRNSTVFMKYLEQLNEKILNT